MTTPTTTSKNSPIPFAFNVDHFDWSYINDLEDARRDAQNFRNYSRRMRERRPQVDAADYSTTYFYGCGRCLAQIPTKDKHRIEQTQKELTTAGVDFVTQECDNTVAYQAALCAAQAKIDAYLEFRAAIYTLGCLSILTAITPNNAFPPSMGHARAFLLGDSTIIGYETPQILQMRRLLAATYAHIEKTAPVGTKTFYDNFMEQMPLMAEVLKRSCASARNKAVDASVAVG